MILVISKGVSSTNPPTHGWLNKEKTSVVDTGSKCYVMSCRLQCI